MSSTSILFLNRPGEWRDVHGPFRSITITASYNAHDRAITGPLPRYSRTFAWSSTKKFEIRPANPDYYSTAMRDSCCGCNWFTIDGAQGIASMDSSIAISPPWDPITDPQEDTVSYGTMLYKRADLLNQPGFENLGSELTAENYMLLDCRFGGWFMQNIGNYYQEMINPDDPTGPSILREWNTKTVTALSGIQRDWTRENGSWVSDCGIIVAFPADRRSEEGCVKPTDLTGAWTINAVDLAGEFQLTGSFTMSIGFEWAS